MKFALLNRGKGWVAEYCQLCRDVQAMSIVHQRETPQTPPTVYARCSACGIRYATDPTRYVAILRERPDELGELVKLSNPRLPLMTLERVAWDRRAVEGTLEAPERAQVLRHPFLMVGYLVPKPVNAAGALILAVFVGLTAGGVLSAMLRGVPFGRRLVQQWTEDQIGGWVCLGLVGAAVVGVPLVWAWRRRRVFRRKIEPRLARGLRPMRPTVEELASIGEWLRMARNPMWRLFCAPRLHGAMRALRDESFTNVDELRFAEEATRMREKMAMQGVARE